MTLLNRSRAAVVATLIGASFVATPVLAQTSPPKAAAKTPAAAAATSGKSETVEQRITTLHNQLKITPDQEAKWTPVAQAMRDNAATMDKLAMSKQGKAPAATTAVEDLETYQQFAQAHVDGLKNLTAAFKDLYNSMPDAQKKSADVVFDRYGQSANR
jgi:protein CpxP